jgi:hypothetical protein
MKDLFLENILGLFNSSEKENSGIKFGSNSTVKAGTSERFLFYLGVIHK